MEPLYIFYDNGDNGHRLYHMMEVHCIEVIISYHDTTISFISLRLSTSLLERWNGAQPKDHHLVCEKPIMFDSSVMNNDDYYIGSNRQKQKDPHDHDQLLLEDDGSDDENAMYDEYELETLTVNAVEKDDDNAEQTTLYAEVSREDANIDTNIEDMTYASTFIDDGDEDMACYDEYIDPSDEDMICDDEYYIDIHDEDMSYDEECTDAHDKEVDNDGNYNALRTPHLTPMVVTRCHARRSYLTTKPPISSTAPLYASQIDQQMIHTTVQRASSDSLTLIGILKEKQSVHRSCFLGFFCGDGYNYEGKQTISERSTEFYWLNSFIKAFKCTNVDLKYVYIMVFHGSFISSNYCRYL